MKQTELLDLLLKGLYEEGKDDFRSFGMIINKYQIPIEEMDELRRLTKRLESDGLITKPIMLRSDISARLSSRGIDYCEGNSYTYSGQSLITNNYNITVENSTDTTIVNQSEDIIINKSIEIKNELQELLIWIENEFNVPEDKIEQLRFQFNSIIKKI